MYIKLKQDSHKFISSEQHYVVYAIAFKKELQFVIQLDEFPSAPSFFSSNLFHVTDSRTSSFWSFPKDRGSIGKSIISFSDWANDPSFYRNLVDSTGDAGNKWREMKLKMDYEFGAPDLENTANQLKDGWISCMLCDEVWNPATKGEVVKCPNCQTCQFNKKANYDV